MKKYDNAINLLKKELERMHNNKNSHMPEQTQKRINLSDAIANLEEINS